MYQSIPKRLPIFVLLFCLLSGNILAQSFITTWKTDNSGPSEDDQVTIPTTGTGYDYAVDWGDGMSDSGVTGDITHTYAIAGTYTVSISGLFPRIYFDAGGFFGSDTDHDKILTVEAWGDIAWTSMAQAFSGCENLRINASDAPDLSSVTSMSEMFYDAIALNDNINNWEVGNVITMYSLFRGAEAFNQPLDLWTTDNVEDMGRMFWLASDFNQDIGGWNVGSVEDMSDMFGGATSFDQDIGGWNVSSVSNMSGMFSSASTFNQDISGWVTISLTSMSGIFNGATLFDQDVSGWNISGVSSMSFVFAHTENFNQDITGWVTTNISNMSGMFNDAESFNQDISGWDVSGVNNMENMFNGATVFNQDISGWNVSGVGDMSSMFEDAAAFNQDISGWTVGSVDDMRFMFSGATSFNQNLGGWDMTDVSTALRMLDNSGISVENYDNLLIGWSSQSLRSNVSLDATNVFYCGGEAARTILETTFNWNISDGGQSCITVYDGSDTSTPQISNGQTTPIDFGSIDVLPSTKSRSITIENELAGDLTNVAISITGSAFSVDPTPPTTIIAGATETITVVLSGATSGLFTETLTITSDDFTDTFQFDLSGAITAIPEPEIAVFEGASTLETEITDGQLDTYYLGYGIKYEDVIEEITLTNKGSATLNISNMSISGSAFSFASTTPTSIAVDATETIEIVLDGSVAGEFTETLTITSDDTDEASFNFDIEGEIIGPDIAVFQGTDIYSSVDEIFDGQIASLDLGEGPQGTDVVQQITIANFSIVDLNISDISITGSAFSINAVTPFIIDAEIDGDTPSVIFELTLSGITAGNFNETITITNDDDDESTFEFSLSGTINSVPEPEIAVFGISPAGEISDGQSTAVSFDTEVQGTDITKQFRIENQGSSDLAISSISISGSAFSLGSTAPSSIGAGLSEIIDVILSGVSGGFFTETVTILNDDADESTFDFQIIGEITATNSLPTISLIADASIDEDGSTGDLSFTISDTETNLNDLIVTASSDNAALVSTSGIVLTGTGGDRAINVTPESNASGSTIVTVQVDDGEAVAEVTFILSVTSVNDAPIITAQESLSIPVNTSIDLLLSNFTVTDVDNDYPTGFSLVINDGQNYDTSGNTVTPDSDFVGNLTVPVMISDGNDSSDLFNVTISIIEAQIEIDFDGQSVASGSTISFDDIPVGAEDNRELVITNTGTTTLVITEIEVEGEGFRLDSAIPDPILAGESALISIVFQPTSIGSKTATVTVSSASAADFIATLTASGLSEVPALEVFNLVTVQKNGKHDFLEIRNIEFYDTNRVFIYNRWGNEVFKTTDYDNSVNLFSGNSDSGNELPDGTYYYVIELNGGETIENGFFLLRK